MNLAIYTIPWILTIFQIPENISFEAAATVTSVLVTSFLALYNQQSEQESLRLKPFWKDGGSTAYAGKPIFILGGATSLGQSGEALAYLSSHLASLIMF